MSLDDVDYDSDSEDRKDYRHYLQYNDVYQSNMYGPNSPLCERNVQIWRVPDPRRGVHDLEPLNNLFFYRTDIQSAPFQIRLDSSLDSDAAQMRISTLANDDSIPKNIAKCLCIPCTDDVTWNESAPLSCENCAEDCGDPACPGYRRCKFHCCACDMSGRYNLRSGRR
jgi:hypothetical protein